MNTGREPVALAGVTKAVISTGVKLLLALGVVALTGEQVALLLIFVDNALDLIALAWARLQVTPIGAAVLPAGTMLTTPSGSTATVRVTRETDRL